MDEIQRFSQIESRASVLSSDLIRYEERYKNEKEKLEKLLDDIRKRGYDPTKLAEIRDAKKAELQKKLSELEQEIASVSEKIKSIEVAQNA